MACGGLESVNTTAQKAMLQESSPTFPVGAVIVKEKYTTEKSRTPELMTVMRKHAKGYDSENGDWEYLVLDGKSGKIEAQGHLANCQECHRMMATTDYVFRTPYLSAPQKHQLQPAQGRIHPSY